MIKKSITVIASGLLVANIASATELYNKDGTTFSFGGYLKMGYQSSGKDLDGKMSNFNTNDTNNSRINFGGTKEINENLKGFALVEWKINPFNKGSDDKGLISNRLGYLGLEHTTLGKVTFGRQWSAYHNVAKFTDEYEIKGGESLGMYEDGDAGGFDGTGRANNALKYDVKLGSTQLAIQYQAQDEWLGLERKYSFGASVVQGIGDNLKIGVAGNYAKLNDTLHLTDDVKLDRASAVAGIVYENDYVLTALTGSYNTNARLRGITESSSIGQESFIGVKVAQPAIIYVGNNLSVTSYDDKDGQSFSKTLDQNYVAIGARYNLSSDFSISTEYKYDLRNEEAITRAEETSKSKNQSNFAIVAKYVF